MAARRVYLDSSSIVKRDVEKRGSPVVDLAYEKAEIGKLLVDFSIWNVGEVLSTLDKYRQRRYLTEKDYESALTNLIGETLKIGRLGFLDILPITAGQLTETWRILLRHHIYAADALQVSAAKEVGADLFLSADRSLIRIGREEGLQSYDLEEEAEKITELLSGL